ncbi:hypothetical protein ETU08_10720 [Apibacter muscae]|uniref:Uncharacterized protein n=1 Tax=Apibacter muscae TaxID=2509004 RepID=A0A563D8U3_9FLAO|nr:hypothetical protein [Apibacter muscae]TWP26600.1 hypothetical protein ETU09_08540 [Apibacter muscae]TWP28174.1 hypothetical protein ETU08_10720 [Apibacter muscae]
MKKIIFIFFTVSSYFSIGQVNSDECRKFTIGEFNNINNENLTLNSVIIRNKNKQLEIVNGIKSNKNIRWLNDCDYILFFDKKEAKKDPFKKFINDNGGISISPEKIEGNTLYYKSYYFDGKRGVKGSGKLIKTSSNPEFR